MIDIFKHLSSSAVRNRHKVRLSTSFVDCDEPDEMTERVIKEVFIQFIDGDKS